MKKAKPSGKYIRIPDVIFKTLVHDELATVVAEQGIVMLKVNGDPQPYFLPAGVSLPASVFGQDIEIIVRDITHEAILDLQENDIREEDLGDNPKYLPVDQWSELERILEERKIRLVTKNTRAFSTCLAGVLFAVVSTVLANSNFILGRLCYIGTVIGVLIAAICLVKPIKQLFSIMDVNTICDGENNFVNLETGITNLNGGIQIPVSHTHMRDR